MREAGTPDVGARRRTAHELARDTLRHEIMTGKLPGGSRLIQSDIAERLGVSTTPVREALRDIATEGLVRFDAHRGAIVQQVDGADLREIYEMRRRLEPLVMELAVERITSEEMARARDLHEQMVRETVPGQWVELNRAFHTVFMDACGWSRLATTVKSLHASASPYVALTMRFRPTLMSRGNEDHGQLLQAFADGDTAAAVRVMEGHMDITKYEVEGQLDAGQGP